MEEEKIIRHIIEKDFVRNPKDLLNWISQSEENQKKFIGYRNMWALMQQGREIDDSTIFAELQKFKKRIKRNNRFLWSNHFRKYAASFLIMIALSVGYFLGVNKNKITPDTFTTIACAYGDKTSLVLPDSSKVWLNSGSTLKFNNDFQKSKRELYLSGEAYFSVKKDKRKPFRVKTQDTEVEVLGTEFNLKAYPEEKEVCATLISGKIKFTEGAKETTLIPDQKLVFDKETNEIKVYKLSDSYPEFEWKDGRLVFRNESLKSLELKLERWFDVDIAFADEEVQNRRFTGILERESILEALYYFRFSKYVDYKIEGNKITFFSTKK